MSCCSVLSYISWKFVDPAWMCLSNKFFLNFPASNFILMYSEAEPQTFKLFDGNDAEISPRYALEVREEDDHDHDHEHESDHSPVFCRK